MIAAPSAVIASLYPARLGPVRRARYSPQPNYEIPACTDLNVPKILVVQQQREDPYMGLGRTARRTWEGYEVADDVVREMSGGLPGTNEGVGAEAGVWVSTGAAFIDGKWVIPQSEINAHRKGVDLTLARLVNIARELHVKGGGNNIIPIMHKAAEFLNIAGEPWQQPLTSDARSKCPFCTKVVEMDAEGFPPMCEHCKNVLNQGRFDRVRASIQRHETAIEGTDYQDDPPEAMTPRQKAAAKKAAELTAA